MLSTRPQHATFEDFKSDRIRRCALDESSTLCIRVLQEAIGTQQEQGIMAQYEPPSHTIPPPHSAGPGVQGPRSRAASNASMNKYVPEQYQTPQPGSQADQGSYFPIPQRGRAPSVGGQPISSTPPMPNSFAGYNGFLQPQPQQQQLGTSHPGTPAYTPGVASAHATPGPYTPASGGPPYPHAANELRPPENPPRRRSDASTHSRHSHRSHHSSRRSDSRDRSDRRRRSYEDDYEYEEERRRRERRERRASAPDPDGKDKPKRTRTRPTLGDTVYSSFRNVKYWLGPRDKY